MALAGDAPADEVQALVNEVDAIAEIPNSLGRGTSVRLTDVQIDP